MRPWASVVYGILPEQLTGSTVKTRVEEREGRLVVLRLAEVDLVNDKAEKVLAIQ